MRKIHNPRFVPLLLVAAGLLAACQSTPTSSSTTVWAQPSQKLAEKIEKEAARLPWTHGLERVELINWFAQVGEPAYATLLEMVEDPRDDVAGAALAALGATRDERLVEPLRAIPEPEGEVSEELRLERARTLLRLGDWTTLPAMIEGLRSESLMTRALSFQALYETTRERFDFDPQGTPEEREASVERWEAWWTQRSGDPLLEADEDAR